MIYKKFREEDLFMVWDSVSGETVYRHICLICQRITFSHTNVYHLFKYVELHHNKGCNRERNPSLTPVDWAKIYKCKVYTEPEFRDLIKQTP